MVSPRARARSMIKNKVFQMRISGDFRASLDELRRHEPDAPGRSEMIRRLIERARAALDHRAAEIKSGIDAVVIALAAWCT
jgi:hypothetical protein